MKSQYVQVALLSLVIIFSAASIERTLTSVSPQLAQAVSAGAPAFVQGKTNKAWNGSSVSLTFDTNVAAGNIIAFSTKWESSAVTLNSVSSTCGNNFILVDNPIVYSSTKVAAQGYGIISNSGTCTVTANFSGPAGGWVAMIAHEVTGVDTGSPLDGHATNKQNDVGTTVDAITSGNITTTSNGDYIFGAVWEGESNGPTYTAGSGFTKRISADGITGGGATEDKIQSAAGPVAATFTQSVGWADSLASVMAFRAGSSTTAPPPELINGSCSTTLNMCTTGTFSDQADTLTQNLWQCIGSNGGTSASCSSTITPPPVVSTYGDIIDPNRKIDWSQSGIPGGIPNRTTICATVNASSFGNGTSDAKAGIQNALNNCPANQVVYLSAGKFLVNGTLSIPSYVTLRGAGPQQTILDAHGSGNGFIWFGQDTSASVTNSTAITGGISKGSNTITLASAAGITVGSYLVVTELNDPSFVSIQGEGGACTWCGGTTGVTRVLGQIVEVTSVNGTNIGISPSLYINYSSSLSPQAMRMTAGAKYSGVEDLQVYMNNTGYIANFRMRGSAYSWIKNVESNYTDGDHVQALLSYRGEIRDSYFHDAYHHTPGGTDADVFIADKTSGYLVENNTLRRLHVSIMLNWGAAGNVIAYNFSDGNFDENATNVLIGDIYTHGAHPMFNLIEGNIASIFHPDSYWGSTSHNTVFRNWFKGTTKICDPLSPGVRAEEKKDSCHWAIQAVKAVAVDYLGKYINFAGNIVGSPEQLSLTRYNNGINAMQDVPLIVAPQTRSYDAVAYGYTFGYGVAADDGSNPNDNDFAYTTSLIHGDYTYADGVTRWSPTNSNHFLPPSLYLSSKPLWFGSLSWPAMGPDVSGNKIPAQYCYEQGKMPNCFIASSVITPPTIYVSGDFNKDGVVNSLDMSLMSGAWNTSNTVYDLNKDGTVNTLDYSIMAQNWTR